MTILFVIIGALMFIGLVVVHELGHFLVARRNGIDVEEFGIGFPPRAKVITKRNGTAYTLNWLPLGGFVKLKGEYDAAEGEGTFGSASTWTKAKVLLAGVGMNLVTAFALFTLLALVGMPKLVDNQYSVASDTEVVRRAENEGVVIVERVTDNSPASKAGIREGDRVISIEGQDIIAPQAIGQAVESKAAETVEVKVEREDGNQDTLTVQLNDAEKAKTDGFIGITSISRQEGITIQRSTWSAPVVALGTMWQFTDLTLRGLGTAVASLFAGDVDKASAQVGGPVAIGGLLIEGSRLGFGVVLMLIALISLTLAIMNVLPIPALDGGRLFVMLGFRASKKPLTQTMEEKIHGTGFVALLVLSALIIVADISKL